MASPARKQVAKQEFDEIHDNTSTALINITVDKLKLILTEYLEKLEKTKSWQVPLSILLTILVVFCTANFKDAFGLTQYTWQAIFLISGVLSVVWLVRSFIFYKRSLSLDELVNKIIDKQE